jgi:hypothetical protein
MVCGSCVDKLAFKLMSNYKIDMIRAFELAEKGVERVEIRAVEPPQKPKIMSGTGNPSDYAQNCAGTCATTTCPNYGEGCAGTSDCATVGGEPCAMNTCDCPAPLPNSHQVSNNCTCVANAGSCPTCSHNTCTSASFVCPCRGTCGYDCDPPRVWNPATLQCELPAGSSVPITMHHYSQMIKIHRG